MNKNTVIDKCLEKIPHRFELVVLASQRARMLYLGAQSPIEDLKDKSLSKVDLALEEISTGICTKESILRSFKDTVEVFEEEDLPTNEIQVKDIKDGISYDDFNIDDAFEDSE